MKTITEIVALGNRWRLSGSAGFGKYTVYNHPSGHTNSV